jgi:GNAT superfamily N-acetyltransferase
MRSCSVVRNLRIIPGGFDDYKKLARFHYRDNRPGAYTEIFVIKPDRGTSKEPVGVIVYSMPSAGAELRNAATGNLFAGFDSRTRLSLINENIRCISRVIIEPRFRGLGLASRLVRETVPEMDVPVIEAMAVMGIVNPFFEKAGMKAYTGKMPVRCVKLSEAFSAVGIEEEELIDAEVVHRKIERLGRREEEFIESEIWRFLQSYGERRYERASLKQIRFVLSKLTLRPVYYVWLNKNLELRI